MDYHQLWGLKAATHRHIVVGFYTMSVSVAVVLSEAGFLVTGVDIDENKINQLKNNKSYIHED